jgi:hypothetical protein
MKTKLLILAMFLSVMVSGQTKQVINLKTHISDSTTMHKAKALHIDTMNVSEAIKLAVQASNGVKALTDSVAKANITINGLKIAKPATESPMADWWEYLLGLAAIIIVWCLSFIKSLSQSKIAILKRLGTEASDFVKRCQIIAGSISAIIPSLLGSMTLPTNIVNILNIVEVIALAVTGFSLFLVKNSNDIKPATPPVVIAENKVV